MFFFLTAQQFDWSTSTSTTTIQALFVIRINIDLIFNKTCWKHRKKRISSNIWKIQPKRRCFFCCLALEQVRDTVTQRPPLLLWLSTAVHGPVDRTPMWVTELGGYFYDCLTAGMFPGTKIHRHISTKTFWVGLRYMLCVNSEDGYVSHTHTRDPGMKHSFTLKSPSKG